MTDPAVRPWEVFVRRAGTMTRYLEPAGVADGVGLAARFANPGAVPLDSTWDPELGARGRLLFGSSGFDLEDGHGLLRSFDPETNEVETVADFSAYDPGGVYVFGVCYASYTETVFVGIKPRSNYNTGGVGHLIELDPVTFATIRTRGSHNCLWNCLFEVPTDLGGLYALHGWEGFQRLRPGLFRWDLDDVGPYAKIFGDSGYVADGGLSPPVTQIKAGSPHYWLWRGGNFNGATGLSLASGRVWWYSAGVIRSSPAPAPFSGIFSDVTRDAGPENPSGTLVGFPVAGSEDLLIAGKASDNNSFLWAIRAYADGDIGVPWTESSFFEADLEPLLYSYSAEQSRPDYLPASGPSAGAAGFVVLTDDPYPDAVPERLLAFFEEQSGDDTISAIVERNPHPWTVGGGALPSLPDLGG